MRGKHSVLRIAVVLLALAFVATACGSGGGGGTTSNTKGTRGGTFRIASSGDVDYIDPGQIYYTFSYMLFRVMVRTLVNYPALPGDAGNKLVADIATDTGTVSADGKTYTFHLKSGIKYQPEVAGGREITSSDIRYGIERGFFPSVANGYTGLYFTNLFVGDDAFDKAPKPGTHIPASGIDVSDPNKIVFHLKRATGDFLYRLALPLTAPVPEEYASPFDKKTPSTYGANFAATGPYELRRDTSGKVTGYVATKSIDMVRNKNWDPKTDTIRKAYPDEYTVTEGFDDTTIATDKITNGEFDYNGDFATPPAEDKKILGDPSLKNNLFFNPSNCFRYVFLNTTIPPFDNQKVRQAVEYVINKAGMRLARGGVRLGQIASHVLIPGINGFNDVGGVGYNPYQTPGDAGDVKKALDLMKSSGAKNVDPKTGMYHGDKVLMVGGNAGVAPATTTVVQESLAKIGIEVVRQEYKSNTMYTKYYSVPKQKVAIGTNPGWCWDYPDSYTVIAPLFDGRKITQTANNDYALLNDATLNGLIDQGQAAVGSARAKLWAQADKRVMDDAVVVPWLWDASPNYISKRVTGYQFTLSSSSIDLAVAGIKPGT